MKGPEYIVVVDTERGFRSDIEIIECSNFNNAVKVHRQQSDIWGEDRCRIYMEVVGYGEKV